jgi:hypothetical protein
MHMRPESECSGRNEAENIAVEFEKAESFLYGVDVSGI